MHQSLAQFAAERFNSFCDYGSDSSTSLLDEIADVDSRQPMYARLEYITDYLHLWLLVGDAIELTAGDYGIYMQAVAVILADRDSPEWERVKGSFPETAVNDVHRARDVFFSSDEYVLPSAISPEMYAVCARMSRDVRIEQARRFLASPETSRTGLPHPEQAHS